MRLGNRDVRKKCLKFKVPKMPKVKDENHFIFLLISDTS
jgi:hypothetical protein